MKEIHGRRSWNWPWWKSQIIQKYSNGTWICQKTMSFENDKNSVDKDPYKWYLRQSKRLKAIDPQMNIQMRNHYLLTQIPGELEHAVKCRCSQNCCHNHGNYPPGLNIAYQCHISLMEIWPYP
ncbi:hypothetical protein O181_012229 [Austropuccinia psidii MF-1]|uniref:Uncharacterized protein n=1 Tax=Austropuccinia psidii MF-1 TaxID=1389203 RepID=A0A9Q3BUA8_9BASI|nr:hypothetical protein [Austropuccinia psidii MF-1]